MRKIIDMAGLRFGTLTVIGMGEQQVTGRALCWLCKCDCGVVKQVRGDRLRSGETKSCGCKGSAWRGPKAPPITRKQMRFIWNGMMRRCFNQNDAAYANYGARGITVCERWQSLEGFLADMAPRPSKSHSIDRINNDGPYSPDNCRWATPKQQVWNRACVKLTPMAARVIRRLSRPDISVKEMCQIFNVDPGTIGRVLYAKESAMVALREIQP